MAAGSSLTGRRVNLTFIFGGLATEAYDRSYSDRELVRRIATYMRPHARQLLVVTLALLTLAVLSAAFPVLVARGVDQLAVGGGEALLLRLVAFILAIGVLVWGLNYVRFKGFAMLIGDIVLQMRSDAFSAAVRHDLSFYDEHRSGRVISRVTSDTHEFGQTMRLVGDVINQMAVLLVLMVVLFGIEWRLASLQLVLSPLVFYLVKGWRRIARKVTRQGTRAMANVNAAIQEAITGISVAKNFRQEAIIYEEFSAVNAESYRVNFRRGLVLSTVFPVLVALAGIGVALILYAGGRAVGVDMISAGAWYLFVSTVDRFWFPMMQLAAFWSQFQGGLAAAERVFALIDAEPSVLQTDEDTFTVTPGGISFEAWISITAKMSRCCAISGCRLNRARAWRWSGTPGRANRRYSSCWRAFTSFRTGSSVWAATTCAASSCANIAVSSASCHSPRSFSRARWLITSAMPARARARTKSLRWRGASGRANGSRPYPTGCRPTWASAACGYRSDSGSWWR